MRRRSEYIAVTVAFLFAVVLLIINLDAEAEPKTYAATAIEYTVTETIHDAAVTKAKEAKAAEEAAKAPEFFFMDYGAGWEITAYCACGYCASGTGYTASGTLATEGRTIGVDPRIIPLGATVLIEFENGVKHEYKAEDTGSAIQGQIIDLYFDSHDDALQFGRQSCHVWIKEKNDGRN